MRHLFLFLCVLCLTLSAALADNVTIKVLDPDGKPVAGAKVAIIDARNELFMAGQTAETDATGMLALQLDGQPNFMPEQSALGLATIFKQGYALAGGMVRAGANTFTLEKPISISGNAVDEKGKPVAGVGVLLVGAIVEGDKGTVAIVPNQWWQQFTSVTDTEGKWSFSSISPKAKQAALKINDQHYAGQMTMLVLPQNADTPTSITVYPAASLNGRVLTPDGKGAPGIRIGIRHDNIFESAITDANGAFHVKGIPVGSYQLNVEDPDGKWIADRINTVITEAGKEISIPDITLMTATVIEGTVTILETKEPAAQVSLSATAKGIAQEPGYASTDKDGHYRFLVKPGTYTIRINWAPEGFPRMTEDKAPSVEVTVTAGQHLTAPVLQLSQGVTLTITAVDTDNRPVADAKLQVRLFCTECNGKGCWRDTNVRITTDVNGQATAKGLLPGSGRVDMVDNLDEIGVWQIHNETRFTVPDDKKITVTLDRIPMGTLSGRVIDTDGMPIPGVKVNVLRLYKKGQDDSYGMSKDVMTDAQGIFTLQDVRQDLDVEISALTREGFKQVSRGSVTKQNGVFTAADCVMRACDGQISGMIRNTAGQPVSGVVVLSLDGGNAVRTTTDTQGQFTLQHLPRGDEHLIAANVDGAGYWTGQSGAQGITITLNSTVRPMPQDVALALALLQADEKLPQEQRRFSRDSLLAKLAEIDPQRVQQFITATGEKVPDAVRAAATLAAVKQDPVKNADWSITQLELIYTPQARFELATGLGMLFASVKPPYAEHCYRVAQAQIDAGIDFDDMPKFLILALQMTHTKPEAFLAMGTDVKQTKNPRELLKAAAAMNPEELVASCAQIEPNHRMQLLAMAIKELASSEPDTARRWLEALVKTATDDNHYEVERASIAVITAIGKSDPAAALQIAQMPQLKSDRSVLLAAAPFQPKETALPLLRTIMEPMSQGSFDSQAMPAIGIAYRLEPDTGKAFAGMVKRILDQNDYYHEHFTPAYAYFTTPMNPVESRLMLEVQYFESLETAKRDHGVWNVMNYPLSMASMDIERGLAMQQELDNIDKRMKDRMQDNLLRYILASDMERQTAFFNEW